MPAALVRVVSTKVVTRSTGVSDFLRMSVCTWCLCVYMVSSHHLTGNS